MPMGDELKRDARRRRTGSGYREEVEQAEGARRHDHARLQPVRDPDDPVGIEQDHEQEDPAVSITA